MEASPQRVPTRVPAIAVAGLVAAGAVLRFAWLGRNSLWYDETFTALVSSLAWPKLLAFIRLTDTHPPLYYAVVKLWTAVAGTSEAALRFPSACFGAAVVGATYALARRVTTVPVSLLAALFVALAPIDVMTSQDARMYALLELLAVGS
ncbi:MAG TPA: glycosyltransferase family 39 protein, partial [bacterium]|nr:glycosyltransferase family 39 protein [bacterium]